MKSPVSATELSRIVGYGPFEGTTSGVYNLYFQVGYAGAVIDEVIYPCLVEGTEPGDFYIYK